MNQSNLYDLIEASKRQDGNAFRTIVEHYQSMVYSLAFRLLCNEEDAKDAVQETFVRVWMNLSRYDAGKKFSTWVYAIATHLCYDKLKFSKQHYGEISIDETVKGILSSENVEQQLINSELISLIVALTGTLTPKQKIVFTLRDLEELDMEEVIQITGMSAQKVKSNLYLARQAIRSKLNNY